MDSSDPSKDGQVEHTTNHSDAKEIPQQSFGATKAQDMDSEQEPDCGLQPSNAEFLEQKAEELIRNSSDQRGWRRVVRNFTPSYASFSIYPQA